MRRIDLIGEVFGRLTVLSLYGQDKYKRLIFLCRCECGKKVPIKSNYLRTGKTRSCGCLQMDSRTTHGHSKENNRRSPEYTAYYNMHQRCYMVTMKQFHNYGGRGIKVCDRWLESFENFFNDMGKRPSAKHSLDRFPDKNGNYEPTNCRWATEKQQKRNTTRNIIYNLPSGKVVCEEEFATMLGIHPHLLQGHRKRGKKQNDIINFYIKKYNLNTV